jgi:hypothetical protein
MHPIIHHELMNARAADFHRRAEQERAARAAIQARRARTEQGRPLLLGRPAGVLGRGLRIMPGARSA